MAQGTPTLGRRAIVSRGWAGVTLPDNQPDCIAVGEVNLQTLVTRAARAGAPQVVVPQVVVPQVVVPQRYDQHYWAPRVHHLGIGKAAVTASA